MARIADSFTAAHEVVLIDPPLLRDMAVSLSGLWRPDDEPDLKRRAQLVAAAQLRLYGAADRSGWKLVTTQEAHDKATSRDAEWAGGFIAALEAFEDAPAEADLASLESVIRQDDRFDNELARTLALALLCEQVGIVVGRDPDAYQHQRQGDLPARLSIVGALDAVDRLGLSPGEPAWDAPLEGSLLADGDPWWEPGSR